ncbi:MAG: hypothetical protein JW976_15200 [Syntrophaceae bacterium]|nr:hypothetical protein [Syntrophaceae bacterium]
MDSITNYILAHPAIFGIAVALIAALFLLFSLKSIFKMVLIILVILLAISGFYYIKDMGAPSGKTRESTKIMQSIVDDLKDKSMNIFKDLKNLYSKSKAAPKEVNKLLDASHEELDKDLKKK